MILQYPSPQKLPDFETVSKIMDIAAKLVAGQHKHYAIGTHVGHFNSPQSFFVVGYDNDTAILAMDVWGEGFTVEERVPADTLFSLDDVAEVTQNLILQLN